MVIASYYLFSMSTVLPSGNFGSDQNHSSVSNEATTTVTQTGKQSNEATVVSDQIEMPKTLSVQANDTRITIFTRVLISRGCKSPDMLQNHMMTSINDGTNGAGSTKTFSQFCLTDFCNFGDGRKSCFYDIRDFVCFNLVKQSLALCVRFEVLRLRRYW